MALGRSRGIVSVIGLVAFIVQNNLVPLPSRLLLSKRIFTRGEVGQAWRGGFGRSHSLKDVPEIRNTDRGGQDKGVDRERHP